MKIPFKVEHIDSLGQGVSKMGDKITFIPKTLPDEKGVCTIVKQKGKVQFAQVLTEDLNQVSPKRVVPKCPHFQDCPGCHFLHCEMEYEDQLKQAALSHLISKHEFFESSAINYHPAPTRFGYRNRIQLHYDLISGSLGLKLRNGTIFPIPSCLLGEKTIQHELDRLYQNQHWKNEVPKRSPSSGHLEIQYHGDQVKIYWNRPYSYGGFHQVNQNMNDQLKGVLTQVLNSSSDQKILELFGGNGNLSENLAFKKRTIIDQYRDLPKPDQSTLFISQDLYKVDASDCLEADRELDLLLIDPPRSGLKNLAQWCDKFQPRSLAYVSCDPSTMLRDISSVSNRFLFQELHQFNFFPGTYHFETLVIGTQVKTL